MPAHTSRALPQLADAPPCHGLGHAAGNKDDLLIDLKRRQQQCPWLEDAGLAHDSLIHDAGRQCVEGGVVLLTRGEGTVPVGAPYLLRLGDRGLTSDLQQLLQAGSSILGQAALEGSVRRVDTVGDGDFPVLVDLEAIGCQVDRIPSVYSRLDLTRGR